MRNTDPEIGSFQKNKTWNYLKRTLPIWVYNFYSLFPLKLKIIRGTILKTKTTKVPNFLSLPYYSFEEFYEGSINKSD